jgi:NAD(P)-dependent dehydrogenase (short-subunit alcohol dehydrogenase family)
VKTILITGGASGIGKGIAAHYIKAGERVVVVGSSKTNGDHFINETKQAGVQDRVFFIQADLSMVSENRRITEAVKEQFSVLDTLVFCATRHNHSYTETPEGFESSFALDYLSRFILSYGLNECLERADAPVLMNICGTGIKGKVNWGDLNHRNSFAAQKVMMHGSRLNDLSGVAFAKNNSGGKVKYILYNPMAVQTPGMTRFNGSMMKLIYKLIGKPIEQAVPSITALLDNPPTSALSAYRERKQLSLDLPTYSDSNAERLFEVTTKLLESL